MSFACIIGCVGNVYIFFQPGYWGYDMRRNMSVADDAYGKYVCSPIIRNYLNISLLYFLVSPCFLLNSQLDCYLFTIQSHYFLSYTPCIQLLLQDTEQCWLH